jgi:hypothetical protein
LVVRSDIPGQTLDEVPFFRLAEDLLQMIAKDEPMELTTTGALKRNVIRELYSKRILPEWEIEEGLMKLSREDNSIVTRSLRHTLELSRLVRRVHGKLKLTKEGNRLVRADNIVELFRSLLSTFTLVFAWSSNDGYTELAAGQYGRAYSIYLLMTFRNEPRPVQFYADKYLQSFPDVISWFPNRSYSTPSKDFASCYRVRVFERFFEWFAFVGRVEKDAWNRSTSRKVARRDLVMNLFQFR